MPATRPDSAQLRARFDAAFPGAVIDVIDDSHLHAGHAGAAGGAGHYRARIVSERFAGLTTLSRHRLVYDAVRDWMPDRIHALNIEARTPCRGRSRLRSEPLPMPYPMPREATPEPVGAPRSLP